MKAALVTGASSGIGQAVARALRRTATASRWPRVAPTGSSSWPASSAGSRSRPTSRDREEVQALVEQAVERFGRLDAVVTAAGVFHSAPVEELDEATWDETMEDQRQGHVPRRAGRAAPPPRQQGLPDHPLVGLGDDGPAGGGAYNTSKWAVRGFTQSLLQEVRGEGVRATAISPGRVATPMLGHRGAGPGPARAGGRRRRRALAALAAADRPDQGPDPGADDRVSDDPRVDGVTILEGERMIDGAPFVPLRRIPDERGTIMHMLRRDDPHFVEFGEIYFTTIYQGRGQGLAPAPRDDAQLRLPGRPDQARALRRPRGLADARDARRGLSSAPTTTRWR